MDLSVYLLPVPIVLHEHDVNYKIKVLIPRQCTQNYFCLNPFEDFCSFSLQTPIYRHIFAEGNMCGLYPVLS